jgi:hypothetical protein
MRGKFVFSAVAAGIVLATGMAAPAYADENDSIFISVLDDEGIPYTKASDAILVAKGVCVFLAEGNTLEDATLQVMEESGLGVEESGFFVGAATASYCPSENP